MRREKKWISQGIVLFFILFGFSFWINPVVTQAAEEVTLHEIVLSKNVLEFHEQDLGEMLMVGFVPQPAPEQEVWQKLFENLSWSSSDERVAQVTPDGMVMPVGAGHTYITVVHKSSGVSAMCEVYVKHNPGPEATCTEPQICLTCQEILNPPQHHFQSTYTTDIYPTCGAEGSKSRHCDNYAQCEGKTDVQKIPATGNHTYTTTVIEPTSTTQGYDLHSCTICKNSYKDNYTPVIGNEGTDQPKDQSDQPKDQPSQPQGQPNQPKDRPDSQVKPGVATAGPQIGKTYTKGNLKYKVISGAAGMEAQLTGAKSKKITSLKVPNTVTIKGKKLKVTTIGNNAFKNYKKLKTVVIGRNVTKIGTKAFYDCKKLKKITIQSKKLKNVGKNAFGKTASKPVVKVSASKIKSYKKILKGKGLSKAVQFKKA